MADIIARAMAAKAQATAIGTTNGETVDARTGADSVARASLGVLVREMHQTQIDQIKGGVNSTSVTLQHGQNVVNAPNGGSILHPTIGGKTLVNLLGRQGNFEVDTDFDGVADGWFRVTGGVGSLDSANAKYGSKSQKFTSLAGDSASTRRIEQRDVQVESGKYYVGLVDVVTDGTAASYLTCVSNTSTGVNVNTVSNTTSGVKYVKFTPTTSGTTYFRVYNAISIGAVGSIWIDGARLYEIDSATYAKIDVDPEYTGDKLADKFPYVDGIKHVVNPMITKQGKNMFSSFIDCTTTGATSTFDVLSPYEMRISRASAGVSGAVVTSPVIDVIEGQQYTVSASLTVSNFGGSSGAYIDIYNADTLVWLGSTGTPRSTTGQITGTVTIPAGTKRVIIKPTVNTLSSGTFTFTNPQLELGTTATPFETQNIDYLYAPVTLASNVDGSVKDTLAYRDGAWRKSKRWVTDVAMDGAQAWVYNSDFVGFKRVYIPAANVSPGALTNVNPRVVKFNGTPLPLTAADDSLNNADRAFISVTPNFSISIPDTDTGFAEAYAPIASDIAAYFNGWKISDNAFSPYSSGTKYWTAVESPKANFDGKISGSVVENANIARANAQSNSLVPPSGSWSEFTQSSSTGYRYDRSMTLDGTLSSLATNLTVGYIAQHMFSFNLIEHVKRNYPGVWLLYLVGLTVTDQVTWLKANIGRVIGNWFGFGSGPSGNNATFSVWDGSAWVTSNSTTSATTAKLTTGNLSVNNNRIDANGFLHLLAYAPASDGVTASTINTDFVELEVQLLLQTLPSGYATSSYKPYRLSYQLAATVEEVVNVEGAINLHTGGNQIDVQEGVIVREKVTPQQHSSSLNWFINEIGASSSVVDNPLKNKPSSILAVYRNGVRDAKWKLTSDSSNKNGAFYVSMSNSDYDPTAEYTVTYTQTDKYTYTAANVDVVGTYQTTLKDVVQSTLRRLGDMETISSINIMAIAELYKRVKALGG